MTMIINIIIRCGVGSGWGIDEMTLQTLTIIEAGDRYLGVHCKT